MLRYIWKNISYLFRKQKLLITIILLTQIVSVTAILFSYGIINHYNMKNKIADGKLLSIDIEFDWEESNATVEELQKSYQELLDWMEYKLDYFVVISVCDGHMIATGMGYKSGRFLLTGNEKNMLDPGGRSYTEEEANQGAKVVIVEGKNTSGSKEIDVGGERYEIIGEMSILVESEDMNLDMAFLSLPEAAKMRHLMLNLTIPLNEEEHQEMTDFIHRTFGYTGITIPAFEAMEDVENTKTNNTIILVGILLIFFSVVNYCIMYRYVLEKRKRTLAVYRICGCSRWKGAVIYITELVGMSALVFLLMAPLYHFCILPSIRRMFEYITEFYSFKRYLMIGGVYIISLLAAYSVLVAGMMLQTPTMLSKEGEI